mgnify:CR=1 FL=1
MTNFNDKTIENIKADYTRQIMRGCLDRQEYVKTRIENASNLDILLMNTIIKRGLNDN